MVKLDRVGAAFRGALLAALTLSLTGPVAAKTLYSWRGEDGSYAFTDDPEKIPPRYRSQVTRRTLSGLGDYARFTPQDGAAAREYAERLEKRLESLRAFNASSGARGRGPAAPTPRMISLRTGGDQSPSLELAAGGGGAPILVETLFTRPANKLVTRQSVVVRQGDETLAIIKPRTREWNVATDIREEETLD